MHIVYFYKDGCPFSQRTHETMETKFGGGRHSVNPICVDRDPQGYKNMLSQHCRKRIETFPQIFIDSRHIGGYADFEQWGQSHASRDPPRFGGIFY